MNLHILGVLSLSLCLASPEFIVLDISKDLDSKRFNLDKKDSGEVITHKYTSRGQFKVCKVLDEECVIWDGCLENGICEVAVAHLFKYSSLFLHLRVLNSNGTREDLYFSKKDGFWSPTESDKLPSNHGTHITERRVKFDLNSYPDSRLYKMEKSTRGGAEVKVYYPKLGVKVSRITDGNQTVWESRSSLDLFQIAISYVRTYPCLVELVLNYNGSPENLYFERTNSGWIPMSSDSYFLKIKSNDFYLPSFDIKNLDLTKFTLKEYDVSGIHTCVYTPMLGTNVHIVVEGNMPIWESKVGDYVDKIWIYSRDGKMITTHLRITDSKNRKTLNNYRRCRDGWKLVVRGEL